MSSGYFSKVAAAILTSILLAVATAAMAAGPQAAESYLVSIAHSGRAPVILHVEETGRGRPLILIHGLGGSGYSWRRLVPGLARNNRVFAIDLKGFGRSEKPFDGYYSPSDQARLIAAFMRRRGLFNVTVVGHSFGGAVALALALDLNRSGEARPQRLVLMNSPAYPQAIPFKQSFLILPVIPYIALTAIPPIFTARAGLQSSFLGTSHVRDEDIGIYADPLHEAGGRHALITTTRRIAEIAASGHIENYAQLRMPTLLIWCRTDPVVPIETGHRLAKEMPNARLAIIERCDHTPAEEAPGETLALLRRFLAH
jgi:pimeloyl-ACP methyl ester carboxylesterase